MATESGESLSFSAFKQLLDTVTEAENQASEGKNDESSKVYNSSTWAFGG